MELATPGSAGRLASVARHVTDCATRPGKEPYGLLEIKCPFKYRNKCPAAASDETDFFLEKCGDGLRLKLMQLMQLIN